MWATNASVCLHIYIFTTVGGSPSPRTTGDWSAGSLLLLGGSTPPGLRSKGTSQGESYSQPDMVAEAGPSVVPQIARAL